MEMEMLLDKLSVISETDMSTLEMSADKLFEKWFAQTFSAVRYKCITLWMQVNDPGAAAAGEWSEDDDDDVDYQPCSIDDDEEQLLSSSLANVTVSSSADDRCSQDTALTDGMKTVVSCIEKQFFYE